MDYVFMTGEHTPPSFAAVDVGVSLTRCGCMAPVAAGNAETPAPLSCADGFVFLAAQGGKCEIAQGAHSFALSASQAVLLRGSQEIRAHAIDKAHKSDVVCSLLYAFVRGSLADSIAAQLPEEAFSPFSLPADAPLFARLRGTVESADSLADAYAGAQEAYALLLELCRRFGGLNARAFPELVRHAIAMIEAEYEYLYGIEELAQSLEVSKHHLIREFTRHTGVSPGKYLANTRIKNAKLLLLNPEFSVEIVGQLVGYANGNYFCKAFRAQVGMSPGEYRSSMKEKQDAFGGSDSKGQSFLRDP